jgi:dCMP deaminase
MNKPRQGAAKQSNRVSEDQYYLNIAREVAARGTCLRRKFGAVIVKSKQIISTGYCGSPRGTANCSDIGACLRNQLGAKPGEHYEWCRSVHGEANAIIHAARFDMMGGALYLVGLEAETGEVVADAEPCRMCKRMIINAGIDRVVIQLAAGKIRTVQVEAWMKNNLGEYKKVGGKLVPIRPEGY